MPDLEHGADALAQRLGSGGELEPPEPRQERAQVVRLAAAFVADREVLADFRIEVRRKLPVNELVQSFGTEIAGHAFRR